MAFIKYDQYPDAQFGAGDFTHESGQVVPLYDPVEAARLQASSQAQNAPVADTTAPAPTAMTPQGPETSAPAPAPAAPAPAPAAPKPVELPDGARRLKDDEADNALRKASMGIVNDRTIPMGAVVPMGDGIYGRVEQHTWTNKDGKRVPGHFRGVTLYREPAPQPTSENTDTEDNSNGVSRDLWEGGMSKPPPSKADVTSTTAGEAPPAPAKPKVDMSAWMPKEKAALDDVVKEYPNLTPEGLTAMMKYESGLNPANVSKLDHGNHLGLFQIAKDQAAKLAPGQDITKMSREDQIRLYPSYLREHNVPKDITDADLGMVQGAPSDLRAPDDKVVYKADSAEAKDNPGWRSPSGDVTVGSLRQGYNKAMGITGEPSTGSDTATPGVSTAPSTSPNMNSAAVTQGQTATQGVTSGSTSSSGETVQKGIQDTPEAQAMRQKGVNDYATNVAAAQLPVMQARQGLDDAYKTQLEGQQKLVNEAAQDRVDAQNDYKKSVQSVKDAQQAVMEDKEPPPFGGNILAGILAAFAQGAGAYAAAINHTNNFAGDIINQGLARDNARWKQQHLDKVYGVKDAQELRGDARISFEKAAAQRALLQNQYLEQEFKQHANLIQGAQEQQAAQLLIADRQRAAAEEDAKLQRLAQDQVTQTKQAGETSGTSGSTANTWQTKDKDGKPIDLTKFADGERQGVTGRDAIDDTEHALVNNLAPTLGYKYDPESRHFSLPKDYDDKISRNLLTGAPLSPTMQHLWHPADYVASKLNPEGKAAGEVRSREEAYTSLQTILNDALHKAYGARLNPTDVDRKTQEIAAMSPEGQVKALNDIMDTLKNQTEQLKAKYPGAEDIWQARRANDTQNKPPVSFTPGVGQ